MRGGGLLVARPGQRRDHALFPRAARAAARPPAPCASTAPAPPSVLAVVERHRRQRRDERLASRVRRACPTACMRARSASAPWNCASAQNRRLDAAPTRWLPRAAAPRCTSRASGCPCARASAAACGTAGTPRPRRPPPSSMPVDVREHALPERELIEPIAARVHVELAGRARRATRRRSDRRRSPASGAGRSETSASTSNARAQNARPAGARGAPDGVDAHAQQQDREVAQRPRERMVDRPPLAVAALRTRRASAWKRCDALRRRRASRGRARTRRRRIGGRAIDVVQVREAALVLAEQQRARTRRASSTGARDDRFPERHGRVAARRHDAAARECAGCRRTPRNGAAAARTAASARRMLGEVRQRLVVEPGEPAAEQRRAAIGQGSRRPADRAAPTAGRPRGSRRPTAAAPAR